MRGVGGVRGVIGIRGEYLSFIGHVTGSPGIQVPDVIASFSWEHLLIEEDSLWREIVSHYGCTWRARPHHEKCGFFLFLCLRQVGALVMLFFIPFLLFALSPAVTGNPTVPLFALLLLMYVCLCSIFGHILSFAITATGAWQASVLANPLLRCPLFLGQK